MLGMDWPLLREELALMPGPVLPDGQPSWTLHDPVRNQFFRLDWASFEILQRWWMGDAARIQADIESHTTLHLSEDDVAGMAEFLRQHQLQQLRPGQSAQLARHWAQSRGSMGEWLLHHYLFIRIPLWKPDAWLGRWLPLARRFVSPAFLWATLAALLFGLVQVGSQWSAFSNTLTDLFSWQGLAAYGAAVFVTKLLHELGHAFTAKHFGCRVPRMGAALLVMWPVAYTDTNESWKLTDQSQRLWIASAGILTELVIAAWCTALWAVLPEGALRSSAFVLATTSWIATVAVNASPFMRFDGYFIVSDALDMPNLHARAFALARWQLRELLFGLQEPPPEHFKPLLHRSLLLFAWLTWLYRLGLFIGIALLVYHQFFKLLGTLLFLVEIGWFVLAPLRSEGRAWRQLWPRIRRAGRWRASATGFGLMVLLLFVPWPKVDTATALLRPEQAWAAQTPAASQLLEAPPPSGSEVKAGQRLYRLSSPTQQMRREALQARIERLQWQAGVSGFEAESRLHLLSDQEGLQAAQAELAALETEAELYAPPAPFAGRWYTASVDLDGQPWLGPRQRLGTLVAKNTRWLVETWVDEETARRLQPGAAGRFMLDGQGHRSLRLKLLSIDAQPSRLLSRPELAAPHGGHLLAREKGNQTYAETPVFHLLLVVEGEPGALGEHTWRGWVSIDGPWEAPATRYLRQLGVVLLRELSF